jgi:hypothetical protein
MSKKVRFQHAAKIVLQVNESNNRNKSNDLEDNESLGIPYT